MQYQSPTEYLKALYMRRYTPFIITGNNETFYELKGVRIPEHEFLALFPIADKVVIRHDGQFKGDGIGSAGI